MSEAKEGKADKVFVTGVTGFVGSHVAKLASESGMLVKGTVRNMEWQSDLEKISPGIELVLLDLVRNSEDDWVNAMQGCKFLIHVASPFPIVSPENEDDLITPAVEGTKKVLAAAKKAGIQRVSVTASVVTIGTGTEKKSKSKRMVYTNENWTDISSDDVKAYTKSKVMAEKSARDYAKEIDLEITTIHPSYIQGPMLLKREPSSTILAKRILTGDMPAVPYVGMSLCDVRDVAKAHIAALGKDDAQGIRFIVASGSCFMTDLAQWCADAFPEWPVKTQGICYCAMWLVGCCDPEVKAVLENWGIETIYDCSQTREILEIELMTPKQCFLDMCTSLVELGIVDEKFKEKKSCLCCC